MATAAGAAEIAVGVIIRTIIVIAAAACYVGPGYGYSDYGYSDGECAWLYRRAVRTGSGYWWRRYRDCID